MDRNSPIYAEYVKILHAELIPAMGCTEPIAIAYASSVARQHLGSLPRCCLIEASGNIIKNVKSVSIPNTGGLKGIEAAVAAGVVAGQAESKLQVLSRVSPEQKEAIRHYHSSSDIRVVPATNDKAFYLRVTLQKGEDAVQVTVEDFHTNITSIEKNGVSLFTQASEQQQVGNGEEQGDRSMLHVEDIISFADSCLLQDVEDVLTRQIQYNVAISQEGLQNPWGAQIGRTLLQRDDQDIRVKARAAAAAGSDARMSGCELPVIIVSGSGNQGMTASLPVIEYAKELKADRDTLLRALLVSNLITIHQKTSIGRLSAFCGAVSAGCGAAAGIAYLHGHRYEVIAHTVVNTLAILSGMICDGAKPSCAAKIAMAVEAGIMGYEMYIHGENQFMDGEGIVKKGVDNTISTVGRIARDGMRATDREILSVMTEVHC